MCFASTVTPGRVAPVLSLTVPRMAALTACASTPVAPMTVRKKKALSAHMAAVACIVRFSRIRHISLLLTASCGEVPEKLLGHALRRRYLTELHHVFGVHRFGAAEHGFERNP